MNTDALESFAVGRTAQVAKKGKAAWAPPTQHSFALPADPGRPRVIIAVDQSITATGAVLMGGYRTATGIALGVERVRSFATTPVAVGGFEETLQRAVEVHELLQDWLDNIWLFSAEPVEVVHEQPPIGGGRIVRPESSLLAALALRIASRRKGYPVASMVAPMAHKNFICGNPRADKKEQHAALMPLAADLGVGGLHLITNEGLRDALAVGLCHLSRPYPKEQS